MTEIEALQRALGRETEPLVHNRTTIEKIMNWLVDLNEPPRSERGFAELQKHYETLATY